jgi:DNA-binding IscR family transcriptional regulator
VLSTLAAHPDGAIVANLAAELGASVSLVERRLYTLKRQGLVKTERLGTPPVTHWMAL